MTLGGVRTARIAAAGAAYFALAFAAGFALGTIRVLAVVPRIGERAAELVEAPLMLAVVVAAARFVVRRFVPGAPAAARLAVGLLGVALLLAVEFTVVLGAARPVACRILRRPRPGGGRGLRGAARAVRGHAGARGAPRAGLTPGVRRSG